MYHFCVYFDINYLPQGLALYRSLVRHCGRPFMYYVLCLDGETMRILQRLQQENIVPIALEDVEQWDERLLAAKQTRSRIEYYFTLSPALPAYVIDRFADVDCVTLMDADLLFFGSPECIYDEMGDASILITEHRFSPHLKQRAVNGRFNVQYQTFRNDDQGRACLQLWREQCLEWCYDRVEDGRFADQKYLDQWPEMYDKLVISQQTGVGLAPWNVNDARIESAPEGLRVNGEPLVFFHFHGFKWLGWSWCKTGLHLYYANLDQAGKKLLFSTYLRALEETARFLAERASCVVSPYRFRGGVRYQGSWFHNAWLAVVQRDYFSPWIRRI